MDDETGRATTGATTGASDDPEVRRALEEALEGLGERVAGDLPDRDGTRWLRVGLRIGLGRPALAGRLLELTAGGAGETGDDPGPDEAASTRGRAVSSLLVRSAAMTPAQRREAGPEVTFGWATGLRPGDVLALGHAVREQLDAGATADLGKAFGVAWDAGVRLPHGEREGFMAEFVALQEAIGSALAGRDLRQAPQPASPLGLVGLVDRWVRGARAERSPASSMVEGSGEPGRLGLVAAWNAWMALRYRSLVPPPVLELLLHPWRTVVGPVDTP
jgi:hypothetical protein